MNVVNYGEIPSVDKSIYYSLNQASDPILGLFKFNLEHIKRYIFYAPYKLH